MEREGGIWSYPYILGCEPAMCLSNIARYSHFMIIYLLSDGVLLDVHLMKPWLYL